MTAAIVLDDVSFGYHHTPVLSHVSFTIEPGECIGIIGPNGGGKTTLLRLIMGFLRPVSGSIKVFGNTPGETAPVGTLAYVPQSVRFDREFPISVLEVVLSGLLFRLPWYGCFNLQDRQAAMHALEQVGMQEWKDRPFGTLSGGQAQRVLIARALVSEPKLLLLDEPTASVDPQAEADIYGLLQKLKKKLTILMVTHDLNAAINNVERVLCVQNKVFALEPRQVCEHFAVGLYHPILLKSNGG